MRILKSKFDLWKAIYDRADKCVGIMPDVQMMDCKSGKTCIYN